MADITGTVLDSRNVPMPGVTMILAGPGANSVVQLTGGDGTFGYAGVPAGNYKLTAVHGSFGYAEDKPIAHTGAEDTIVHFAIPAQPARGTFRSLLSENKYLLLKYLQYIFLGLIGAYFFKKLVGDQIGDLNLDLLRQMEVARGAITYLVAVTTVAMAAILMLAAIMTGGKDLDRRFALGKEILTLLIGILGTIIGFYYGSSVERGDGDNGQTRADSVQVSNVTLDPASPKAKEAFTLNTGLEGGTRPYTYYITFVPPITADTVTAEESEDGKISKTFKLFDTIPANTRVRIIIRGKDKNNVPFTTPDDDKHHFSTSQ